MSVAQAQQGKVSVFDDRFQFIDHIHGQILLNRLERDAIDTPEFQRLYRIAQLGLVDITYQTGNHTRGAHSIGTCRSAQILLSALKRNARDARQGQKMLKVSRAEKVLIRLGALLHDIPHGPFSHDIEKKKHLIRPFSRDQEYRIKSAHGPFDKHDDYKSNAAFYIAVFDREKSVLARVLNEYSRPFWELLLDEKPTHLKDFLEIAKEWEEAPQQILPELLFHLFSFEEIDDAEKHTVSLVKSFGAKRTDWHLGPPHLAKRLHLAWYQPFRHEVIGNTLSADLMDYLARDCEMLRIGGGIDDSLLRHYILTQDEGGRYRCAIDLSDHKRGIIRTDRLNDIFQMLEVRHAIHEKAVYHRMAQSALAMLSRAVKLGQQFEKRFEESLEEPKHELLTAASLYGFDSQDGVAVRGDEHFLTRLVRHPYAPTKQLAKKLAERRLFRPLMIIPGHRVRKLITSAFEGSDAELLDRHFRELAAIIDAPVFAPFFNVISTAIESLLRHEFTSVDMGPTQAVPAEGSLGAFLRLFEDPERAIRLRLNYRAIFWTLPYKQLFKDPAIVVTAQHGSTPGPVLSLDALYSYPEAKLENEEMREFGLIHERVKAGIRDADVRYSQLWKIYVFLSDGLFYGGNLAKLVSDPEDYSAGCADGGEQHVVHLRAARNLAAGAIEQAWHYWDEIKRDCEGDDNITKTSQAGAFLAADKPSSDMMQKLIERVLIGSPARGASEVRLEQYQHGEGETQSRCRDVRYRFERPTAVEEGSPFGELLQALKIERSFFSGEIEELTETLRLPDREFIAEIANAEPAEVARRLRLRTMEYRLAAMREGSSGAAVQSHERASESQPLSVAIEAMAAQAFDRAKELLRPLRDGESPDKMRADALYLIADSGVQYGGLIARAREQWRLGEAKNVLTTLSSFDDPVDEKLLHPLLTEAFLLRASANLRGKHFKDARRDLSSAARFAVTEEHLSEYDRLHRIEHWQSTVAEIIRSRRDAAKEVAVSTPPKAVNDEMQTIPVEEQDAFLRMVNAELDDAVGMQRNRFDETRWRSVLKTYHKTRG